MCRGVYRLAHHPVTWESRLWAALLEAGPGAVVSHRSAARLHGAWRYRFRDAIEVSRVDGYDHRVRLGRLHRTNRLPPEHVTVVDGFPVTTLARTCFDLAGDPDPGLRRSAAGKAVHARNMGRVVNDALARRGLTFVAEVAVFLALAGRGRSGTVLMRRLLKKFGPHYVPTHSEAESLFAELAEAFDVPPYDRQVPMSDEQGWIGNVDALFRDVDEVVEVDSSWHDGPLDKEEDAERDRRLTALGLHVNRITYGQMVFSADKVMRALLKRLRRPDSPGT